MCSTARIKIVIIIFWNRVFRRINISYNIGNYNFIYYVKRSWPTQRGTFSRRHFKCFAITFTRPFTGLPLTDCRQSIHNTMVEFTRILWGPWWIVRTFAPLQWNMSTKRVPWGERQRRKTFTNSEMLFPVRGITASLRFL